MESLHSDVVGYILNRLSPSDLAVIRFVCQRWRHIIRKLSVTIGKQKLTNYTYNLKVAQWVHSKGCKIHGTTIYHAIREGHLDFVKWAYPQKKIRTKLFVRVAMDGDQLHVLEWLKENNLITPFVAHMHTWKPSTIMWGLTNDSITLHWDFIGYIVDQKYYDVLEYMYKTDQYWDYVKSGIKYSNDLELIKWAHERAIPLSEYMREMREIADISGNCELVEWLDQQRP